MKRAWHEWIVSGSVSENLAIQRGYTELVRCRDCVKRGFDDCPVNGWMPNKTDGDWFCADGVKRDA